MTTEKIIAHATIAATYFRRLVEEGVPAPAAVNLTGQYVTSIVFAEIGNAPPREPWQDGGQ